MCTCAVYLLCIHTESHFNLSSDALGSKWHLNREDETCVQSPLSFPLTNPSQSRNHCMLMQYMTTGDSSSWNALFSYGRETGNGGGVMSRDKGEEKGCEGMGRRNKGDGSEGERGKKREREKKVSFEGFTREMFELINPLWCSFQLQSPSLPVSPSLYPPPSPRHHLCSNYTHALMHWW